jgi:hypothetical protein
MSIIGRLKAAHINTNNINEGTRQIIAKVADIEDKGTLDELHMELLGHCPQTSFAKESEILLKYMVHRAILQHNNREAVVYDELLAFGVKMTNKFFKEFSFLHPGYVSSMAPMEKVSRMNEITQQMETITVPVQRVKAKKEGGSKSDQAYEFYMANRDTLSTKEIKEHFIKVIGLSTAGCNTYMTTCKKKAANNG